MTKNSGIIKSFRELVILIYWNVKLAIFRGKWKIANSNNYTKPLNVFPIEKVSVGKNTYGMFRVNAYDNSEEELIIGNYCSIAEGVQFVLGGEHNWHRISTYPYKRQLLQECSESITKGKIIVQDDVWLGHGSIVLSGVTIGQGAIIAAGAVVSKDVPPYAIVGGVPAKVIKYRFSEDIIKELLKVDYSKLTDEMIKEHANELYNELTDKSQLAWMPKK